jgi:hypothetical protein
MVSLVATTNDIKSTNDKICINGCKNFLHCRRDESSINDKKFFSLADDLSLMVTMVHH